MAVSNRKPQTSPAQESPIPLVQRVAVYARVSTQRDQNPEMQRGELRQYAERRGWQIVGEYVDRGVSGAKNSRPELNRLMSDAHQRKFGAIAVRRIGAALGARPSISLLHKPIWPLIRNLIFPPWAIFRDNGLLALSPSISETRAFTQ